MYCQGPTTHAFGRWPSEHYSAELWKNLRTISGALNWKISTKIVKYVFDNHMEPRGHLHLCCTVWAQYDNTFCTPFSSGLLVVNPTSYIPEGQHNCSALSCSRLKRKQKEATLQSFCWGCVSYVEKQSSSTRPQNKEKAWLARLVVMTVT